jgi:acyl-CoA thioester hydrolase
MGFLYYGHYALYYELGRVEALRSLGIRYRDMEDELDIMLPVVSMECKYLRPARYDDVVKIVTELRELPDSYINFHYELYNEKEALLNIAKVKLCFYDRKLGRRIRTPEFVLEKLNGFFE